MKKESKFSIITMECGEKCSISFELSPLKRLLSWLMNDMKPKQPLIISVDAKMIDGKQIVTINVDNNYFKRFWISNVS